MLHGYMMHLTFLARPQRRRCQIQIHPPSRWWRCPLLSPPACRVGHPPVRSNPDRRLPYGNVVWQEFDVIYLQQLLWCSMMFYDVLWCSMMFYDVLWCSMELFWHFQKHVRPHFCELWWSLVLTGPHKFKKPPQQPQNHDSLASPDHEIGTKIIHLWS